MNEIPNLPLRIGYDRRRIVRSALALLAVAVAAGAVLTGVQRARPSALGNLATRDLGPVPLLFAIVVGLAVLVAAVAVVGALQRRDFVVLKAEGIEFHNSYGVFLVEWPNITRIERAPAGYVGIQLTDRERLLQTHRGSPEQRQLLSTLEPYQQYDLILHPEELSCGVDPFIAWTRAVWDSGRLQPYSKNSVRRSGEE